MNYKDYLISQYPNEAGGYFKDKVFYPIENIAEDKTTNFVFDGRILIHDPELIIHSHVKVPNTPLHMDLRIPSDTDMEGQLLCNCEWGICVVDENTCSDLVTWGNPDNRPPLIEREFIYNIQDCLSLVQDYYYQKLGIILPNHPRAADWDQRGETYIDSLYKDFGFSDVNFMSIQEHDIIMFKFPGFTTTNHLGIYLGNGIMLHHQEGQISTKVKIDKWVKRITRIARHKDLYAKDN